MASPGTAIRQEGLDLKVALYPSENGNAASTAPPASFTRIYQNRTGFGFRHCANHPSLSRFRYSNQGFTQSPRGIGKTWNPDLMAL